jgi:hypothetical protein
MQSPASNFPPVLVTLSTQAILHVPQPRLCNRKTDWDAFRHLLNERLLLNIPPKTDSDIESAIKNFNIIQWASWTTTPEHTEARQTYDCPILIKQKLLNKRRLRRNWHRFRTPENKRLLNAVTRELKQLLASKPSYKTSHRQHPQTTPYGKGPRKPKILPTQFGQQEEHGPQTNTQKAQTFVDHLTSVFQPHPSENPPEEDEALAFQLEIPYQLEPPLSRFHR